MIPHPDYPHIEATIRTYMVRGLGSWSGALYRNVAPKYSSSADLLSGAGAFRMGSRWSWPGLDRVIFGSTHPDAAYAEWRSHATRTGIPRPEHCNRDTRAFMAELHRVLDLTGAAELSVLGLDPQRLLDIPWQYEMGMGREAITQAVGRAVHSLGIEGILVPCAPEPSLTNVVIYLSNLDSRSRIDPL